MNLENKVAIITGSTRGIGNSIAKLFLENKAKVVICGSTKENAEKAVSKMKEELNLTDDNIMGIGLNMKDSSSMKSSVDEVIKKWKKIDVLVNNAGIRRDNLMVLVEPEDWFGVLNTNLSSFYNVTRPLLTKMLRKKNGRIINMASLSGIKGLPGQTNYSAAKGGLIAATKALAQEVAKKKVTVNAVAPGFIKTDMVDGLDEAGLTAQIPAGRFGEAREVAELVGFLASENAAYINGEVISINGALYT